MREVRHQLEADLQVSRERHVFEEDWHRRARQTLSYAHAQDDLRVDFVQLLTFRQLGRIVRGERQPPLHDNDIILRAWVRLYFINPWCLRAKGERAETKRIQERRAVLREDLVD